LAISVKNDISIHEQLNIELIQLLHNLGHGRTDGVAYDTAWVARLTEHYSHKPILDSLNWIRHHQHIDGTWGAPIFHAHDRYLSTLAAIVALKTVGNESRDLRRIKRGETALWRIVGKILHDDHDTIGFPVLASRLTEEARELGLDVPEPTIRYAGAYNKRVEKMLSQPHRNWRVSPLSFSIEVLRHELREDDTFIDGNQSVAVSPSATAGYLLEHDNEATMQYLLASLEDEGTGAARAVDPIDDFEVVWAINHLRYANLISSNHPEVKRVLDNLWETYNAKHGLGYASCNLLTDVDGTAAGWAALHWGGYPVTADIFAIYEVDDHFQGFINETDPALSAHVRLLVALRSLDDSDSRKIPWIQKIIGALHKMDNNGAYWTDKWHISPYYVNSTAVWALYGLDDKLVNTRLKWILRTQNDDGGWGFYGESTPEETAYCMEALLWWDRHVERIDDTILNEAANFLMPHVTDERYTPLWIGKSLYSPHYVVKAAIIGAMYRYLNREA
jgi:halimadienyl-diphosphate synthase